MKRMRPTEPAAEHGTAPAVAPAAPAWAFGLLVVLFAASGAAALIHEVLWFQVLELVVGSSAVSLGILLGTYMGGMCLGSLLLPRFVSRAQHPVRVYGLLELGVGVLAVLVFFVVPLVGRLLMGSGGSGASGLVVRGLVACLCLLPPTALMGATLPAIARWVEATPRGASGVGALYTSNLVGAIAGCLLAGFHLLRFHPLVVSMLVAAGLNLVVGGVSWWLARHTAHMPDIGTAATERTPVRLDAVHVVTALSGFGALGGQVVWTRVLALLMGATVYTFSIILAVFLFGLGLGSSVGSLLSRSSRDARRDLGLCQLLLAAAVAWSAYAVNRSLPWWPVNFNLSHDPWITFQLDLARAAWALLPPTVLWGASFPLAIAAATRADTDPGRVVATVYAANTVGAIAGSLAFTFLLPLLGSQGEQRVLIGVAAAAALLLLTPRPGRAAGAATLARAAALTAALAVAALLALRMPPLPQALVALGRFATFRLNSPGAPGDAGKDPLIQFMGEGLTESVAVSEKDGVRVFHVSGKIEASSSYIDMRLQRLLGHLPALVHPEPKSVLIVGCGAGVTAGSFVTHPGIRRIVICEIEPMVPQHVTPYFANENHGVLSDPRVEVVYDDARHYVLTTREKFDIVTSDPIHPWVAGSAALYSADYYRLVRRILNPGGVVSQWVPVYQASEDAVKSELATFFQVFPNGTAWAGINRGAGFDMVMLGTEAATRVDLAALRERSGAPAMAAVNQSLLGVGYRSAFELLSSYLGRAQDLKPWTDGAHINRDREPWLQYRAGWDSYTQQPNNLFEEMARYRKFPHELFVGTPELQQALMDAGAAQAAAQRVPEASPPR
ncbi:MAG: fused MFS/spermidine synthase [Candidatus Eisenbacteria bacterium]